MRILYLDLDTLRPDHLGCYGYHRNTSPNIDRIAQRSVRFNNYYCSDAPCLPSRTALMTGRFGIHTGVVGHGGTAADMRLEGEKRMMKTKLNFESLPGFLCGSGFRTISISPFAERHSSWSFYAGFNEMYNTGKSGNESAHEIFPTALKWIKNNAKEDNWFLHVNFWDPHIPYRVPEEFGNPFENDPIPEWITEEVLERHKKKVGPHSVNEMFMFHSDVKPEFPRQPGAIRNLADMKMLIDGYDCGIRYMDQHVGMLLEALEKEGVLEDLAIIVSADHSENMGELGIYQEHGTADNGTCRIPMLLSWPGGKKGTVDNGLHYNLDLAPTLAELLGKPPKPVWDGQSYAAAVMEGKECGRSSLVISQCAHVCQRSVRFDRWLYIRTYNDGGHLFPSEMLFDLETDVFEQEDVSAKYPEICREAVYILNQWHDDMMKSMPYDVDPLWTVIKEGGPFHLRGHLAGYCKRLEETGRGHAVEELKRRHPREFA